MNGDNDSQHAFQSQDGLAYFNIDKKARPPLPPAPTGAASASAACKRHAAHVLIDEGIEWMS